MPLYKDKQNHNNHRDTKYSLKFTVCNGSRCDRLKKISQDSLSIYIYEFIDVEMTSTVLSNNVATRIILIKLWIISSWINGIWINKQDKFSKKLYVILCNAIKIQVLQNLR